VLNGRPDYQLADALKKFHAGSADGKRMRRAQANFESVFRIRCFSQMTSGIKGEVPRAIRPGTRCVAFSMLTVEYSNLLPKAAAVGIFPHDVLIATLDFLSASHRRRLKSKISEHEPSPSPARSPTPCHCATPARRQGNLPEG